MPTTSDGREFPYTADGLRAAKAHEMLIQQQKKNKTMGNYSDPSHAVNNEGMRPQKVVEQKGPKPRPNRMKDRMNDASIAQMNMITGGLLYPKQGPEAINRSLKSGDLNPKIVKRRPGY